MALVVEDGTGLPGATTFAARDELIAFAAERGVAIANSDTADVHLIKAMDYLRAESFLGAVVAEDQGTPFPRTYYLSPDRDDLGFPNDIVPTGVKRAQLLLAVASFQGIDLLEQLGAGRQLKSRDVGPMKRTYDSGSLRRARIAGVEEALAPYTRDNGGFKLAVGRA